MAVLALAAASLTLAPAQEQLLKLYKQYPSLVDENKIKEKIEIIIDPELIAKIETVAEKNLLSKGKTPEQAHAWSRVGVVFEDTYFIMLRDAVQFPNGATGTYDRLFERSALEGAGHGAVALPIQSDGKILFNLQWRHATQNWGMEVARGFSNKEDGSVNATCLRELEQETGMKCEKPISLGNVCANTGLSGTFPGIFLCPLTGEGTQDRSKEAIKKCIPFSLQEVADAIVNGYFEYEGAKIPFVDGFSQVAILKAVASGVITLPKGVKKD